MPTDITGLIAGLDDYQRVLGENRRRIGEAHQAVLGRFRALDEHYEGAAAAEFKERWLRVERAFDAYVEGAPQLLALLEAKTEELRHLDQGF